jgi:hypothetical protein
MRDESGEKYREQERNWRGIRLYPSRVPFRGIAETTKAILLYPSRVPFSFDVRALRTETFL